MAAALELTPALGTGAACTAMGLWRGAPARQQARMHRRTLMGPPAPRAPRPCPPLALNASEQQALLATLNSERFADTAPAAVHATLLGEGTYLGSVRTMYRLLAATGGCRERRNQLTHPACAVKRRRFSSGCKPHPATAPAGSNRSNYGGNEMVEAFG
jgi:putative transposase